MIEVSEICKAFNPSKFEVGQEVIMFHIFGHHGTIKLSGPVSHNNGYRGKVLKVGTKLLHVESRDAPIKARNGIKNGVGFGFLALPIKEAKDLYRKHLAEVSIDLAEIEHLVGAL